MAWKYIVFEIELDGMKVDFPIIFPDKLIHIEVATVVKFCSPLDGYGDIKVVSAGSIGYIIPMNVGGKSTTLNLSSRTFDDRVIEEYSYMHGIRT